MENFEFLSPTKIIFGKGREQQVGEITKKHGSKVLLHYGRGHIKKSGLYDTVVASLTSAGIDFVELGGVQPNPRLSLVKEGIELCRKENVNFILAVGGGSVIDSAKAIGVGVPYNGDVWDFFHATKMPETTLPTGVILTLAAAGSEASKSCVISSEEEELKRPLNSELIRPVFAILNPELTFSLPPYQTACGVADIMAHVLERYFTNVKNVELTDRLCEAVLRTVINNARIVMEEPHNYAARAEIMWAGTLAHNDLLSTGRVGDFASHMIEHELSAIYDVAHGAGLAVVIPAWMKYVYRHNIARFVQYAVKVWNVDLPFEDYDRVALEGIHKTSTFFQEIGLPVTLEDLGISDDITDDEIEEMAVKSIWREGKVGNLVELDSDDVIKILKQAK